MDTEHKRLYDAAVALVQQRYPTGWGGAAAIRLANGDIVTSISPDVLNEALSVCMELGAFLEAHKQNQAVTHSLCLYRDDETAPFKILTPCGICQEHLRFWGDDVQVAVTNPDNALRFHLLAALQPHHWSGINR